MFEVILTREAKKNLRKIHPRFRSNITKCFECLQANPFYGANIKKLTGELEDLFRFRIADIRIVYHINKDTKTVFIIAIGSRGGIY